MNIKVKHIYLASRLQSNIQ
uniref:Uncharacterized protein n=1 Tax=Rhizophora mucronata TaxID=61149 RepID=A0A2P2PHD3_RHIMU